MRDLERKINELLFENRRHDGGWQYTVPAPKSYPYQWFWDSCFHTVILSHIDLEAAKAEFRSLFAHQYPNGLVAHITYWNKKREVLDIDWGLPDTSSLLQPPIAAMALFKVYETSKDKDFLIEMYEPLKRYYQYIWNERRLTNTGLIGIINPDESGEDNSPRFDTSLHLPPKHPVKQNLEKRYELFRVHKECKLKATCTSKSFLVEDVPFNSLMLANLYLLSDIAKIIGKAKDATKFHRQTEQLKTAIRTHLLQAGVYVSLDEQGNQIKTKTAAMFIPLIAGLYTQQEAMKVINNHLLDPNSFWLEAGIPSTSKDDPAYDPKEPGWGKPSEHPHWRGPIWISNHWFIYHGLKKYGFQKEAAEIKTKTLKLLERAGFMEYYHPETGQGQGAKQFTWGALVIDMN